MKIRKVVHNEKEIASGKQTSFEDTKNMWIHKGKNCILDIRLSEVPKRAYSYYKNKFNLVVCITCAGKLFRRNSWYCSFSEANSALPKVLRELKETLGEYKNRVIDSAEDIDREIDCYLS